MAEYIDREKLLRDINHYHLSDGKFQHWVEVQQAADVAPVRHAKWVDNHCTACGMMPMGDEMWKNHDCEPPLFERFMDYCPNCGCRMDGDGKD